jgi:hypothetical protein
VTPINGAKAVSPLTPVDMFFTWKKQVSGRPELASLAVRLAVLMVSGASAFIGKARGEEIGG